ncbi:MAG: hypothetical protein QE271_10970 [Bacteriovoracaceae bacterium]|nr:hypothetical protein [Bacteriovoracaceae bacterium]
MKLYTGSFRGGTGGDGRTTDALHFQEFQSISLLSFPWSLQHCS